ncbi:MAG: hypothetical protein DBY09_06425 [Selenomonadales bacterium]|nr:MAG: hypothetical protein DBY09_06425 [Selenomonadales bacterium]
MHKDYSASCFHARGQLASLPRRLRPSAAGRAQPAPGRLRLPNAAGERQAGPAHEIDIILYLNGSRLITA